MALDEVMWQRFADLFDGDLAGAGEVVEIFLRESRKASERLDAAMQAHDTETIRRVTHNMKSTAHQLGGTALSETCRLMEAASLEGDIQVPLQLHGAFQEQLSLLRQDLLERVGS